MPQWTYICDAADLPPGAVLRVRIADGWYAACNRGGTFHVVDNRCPHADGSLARGRVEGNCLICPVHGWPWDLRTGLTDPSLPHMRLRFFRCEARDGRLYADVTQPILPEDVTLPGFAP
ncbi:MAG: Rieske (2Fe-2S) protein [Phycisphaerae bacterium]|nr:Rieske (2Fe-2S) protein [Phycisphaerae bacterium]